MTEMPRFFGYMVLALFLLCGAASASIYYGTFGPGGGRIDPRFVVFFKFLQWGGHRDVTPQEWRARMNRMMIWAATSPDPVFGVDSSDRVVASAHGAIPIRVYDPKTAAGDRRPLMMFMHGGGFFAGNLDTHDRICRLLASKAGAVVVSVDYRLAPEFPYPAGLEDSYTALLWAHSQAKQLGADPARLVVAGDSAGGNLAAAMALRSRAENGPRIAYQFLIYPVLNLANFDGESIQLFGDGGYFISRTGMIRMRGFYLGDQNDGMAPYASPLMAPDLRGLPPALVLTAEFDPLRSEGEAYVDRLRAQGVDARAHRYLGMGHGFVSGMAILAESDEAIDEIAATLKASL